DPGLILTLELIPDPSRDGSFQAIVIGPDHFPAETNAEAAAEAFVVAKVDDCSVDANQIVRFCPGIGEGCNRLDEQAVWKLETVACVEREPIGPNPSFLADAQCGCVVGCCEDIGLEQSVGKETLVQVGRVDADSSTRIIDTGGRSTEIKR